MDANEDADFLPFCTYPLPCHLIYMGLLHSVSYYNNVNNAHRFYQHEKPTLYMQIITALSFLLNFLTLTIYLLLLLS